MLWRLMPNQEQRCTSTVQCFPNKVLNDRPNTSFQVLCTELVRGTLIHDFKTHCKVCTENTQKINDVFSYWWCCQGDPGNDGVDGEVGLQGFYGEVGEPGRKGETGVKNKPDRLYLWIPLTQNHNSPVLVLGRSSGGNRIQILYLNLHDLKFLGTEGQDNEL